MSKPSLALIPTAYKAGKLYSVLPADGSGDFTVTRNGTATFIGQDGLIKNALANEPRFEYNPNGTFKGVLVQPAATNLITNSSNFNTWTVSNLFVIPNSTIAPDGTLTGTKIISNNQANGQIWRGIGENVSGTIYTRSIYAKRGEFKYLRFSIGVGNQPSIAVVFINLETGIIESGSNIDRVKVQDVGNGWWRISAFNNGTGSGDQNWYLFPRNNPNDSTISGDGTSGIFIWGYQSETGPVATSYIPTLASQVTRPADVMTVLVPTNATQVSYILNGNVVNQSVVGGSNFTLPNDHITQLTMN
jgi:hypothetical protein